MPVASRGNLSSTDPIWCFHDDCLLTAGRTVAVVRSSQSWGKPSNHSHGEEICNDPCHAKFVVIAVGQQLQLTHRDLTVPRCQILRVLNRLFLYSCSKPEHPSMSNHSCTTGNRSRNLCYDSWSLSHLGCLYPGTTPVMIKTWYSFCGVTGINTAGYHGILGFDCRGQYPEIKMPPDFIIIQYARYVVMW